MDSCTHQACRHLVYMYYHSQCVDGGVNYNRCHSYGVTSKTLPILLYPLHWMLVPSPQSSHESWCHFSECHIYLVLVLDYYYVTHNDRSAKDCVRPLQAYLAGTLSSLSEYNVVHICTLLPPPHFHILFTCADLDFVPMIHQHSAPLAADPPTSI